MDKMVFGMLLGGFIGVGISLLLIMLYPWSTSGIAGFEILIVASIFFGGIIADMVEKRTDINQME